MTGSQFGGLVLATALVGIIRGVIRPRYQAWVVERVQSGRWTPFDALKFDHRVDMAIWLPAAFVAGMGAVFWMMLIP